MKPQEFAMDAASILVQRRLHGQQGSPLSAPIRPTNLEQALAIQDFVAQFWCAQQQDSIAGWKCGLPSENKQISAPIFARTVQRQTPHVTLWPNTEYQALVEPELAFVFAHDLPVREAPYTPAEIEAAIGSIHMALELIQSRYLDAKACSFYENLADNLLNQGLYLGPALNKDTALKASQFNIHVSIDKQSKTHAGSHPNGDATAPLYWLVNYLNANKQGIKASQTVITGSFAGVLALPFNTGIEIEYADLGKMQVQFKAR